MSEPYERKHSHLFTLRLWVEVLDGGHTEIRGVVRHVLSRQRGTIRDWPGLQAFLLEQIGLGNSALIYPPPESATSGTDAEED